MPLVLFYLLRKSFLGASVRGKAKMLSTNSLASYFKNLTFFVVV